MHPDKLPTHPRTPPQSKIPNRFPGWGLKLRAAEAVVLLLRTLGAVLRTALLAVGNALRVQNTANDVVADTWQILNTAATDQNNGVLLEIVPFARNIGRNFVLVREPYASHFPHSRVRLLRRGRIHTGANAPFERTARQMRRILLRLDPLALLTHQLINRRHSKPLNLLQIQD